MRIATRDSEIGPDHFYTNKVSVRYVSLDYRENAPLLWNVDILPFRQNERVSLLPVPAQLRPRLLRMRHERSVRGRLLPHPTWPQLMTGAPRAFSRTFLPRPKTTRNLRVIARGRVWLRRPPAPFLFPPPH